MWRLHQDVSMSRLEYIRRWLQMYMPQSLDICAGGYCQSDRIILMEIRSKAPAQMQDLCG